MIEIWKDIPGYEGMYQVSNLGRIKSLSRDINRNNSKFTLKEKILIGGIDSKGYKNVGLNFNSFKKVINIHKLVAMAFLNHIPDGTHKIVVDHINDNKLDNRVENLQLITNRENCSKSRKNTSSNYTGVSWHKRYNKLASNICINDKKVYLGRFNTEEEANEVYQLKLKTL